MVENLEKEIANALKNNKLVIGSKSVLKNFKKGSLTSVIYAENASHALVRDLDHYAKTSGIELQNFRKDASKLGELCGKPYNILTVGFQK